MERAHDVHFRIPSVTLLKLAGFALLALVVVKLWPFFLVVFVAALFAVTLHPLATRIEKRGLSRGPAVRVVAAMVLVLIVGLGALAALRSRVSSRTSRAITTDSASTSARTYPRSIRR